MNIRALNRIPFPASGVTMAMLAVVASLASAMIPSGPLRYSLTGVGAWYAALFTVRFFLSGMAVLPPKHFDQD